MANTDITVTTQSDTMRLQDPPAAVVPAPHLPIVGKVVTTTPTPPKGTGPVLNPRGAD